MTDWANLLASGDITTILIGLLVVFVTGGLGSTIVSSLAARSRGIRGDTIAKDQTGIEGLSKLSEAQDKAMRRLDDKIHKAEERIDDLNLRLMEEIAYSNLNIALMIENGIPPAARNKQSLQGE